MWCDQHVRLGEGLHLRLHRCMLEVLDAQMVAVTGRQIAHGHDCLVT
eukprot:CAMPEP_0174733178 /NCGR_PEP_ID=MMETSP1094-20130205/60816_1 /TAXON_ID=156173 /ORGANISM="Chrysochromulina brevifilum, Strain UTEX LB 985" /LENGTH=46 /DNA_ID= /DNA_START= /DNA_END= /DNA_ORIENTATION=